MSIGKKRHRVTFQSKSTAVDGYGQQLDSWTDICKRWAELKPVSGFERDAESGVFARFKQEVTIRYDEITATVKPYDRLVFKSRIFDIQSLISVGEENGEIKMIVEEDNAAA